MGNGEVNRNALPYPDRVPIPWFRLGKEMSPEERPGGRYLEKSFGPKCHQQEKTIFFAIGDIPLQRFRVYGAIRKGIWDQAAFIGAIPVPYRAETISKPSGVGVLGDSEWKSLVAIKQQGQNSPLYPFIGGGLNILPFYGQ